MFSLSIALWLATTSLVMTTRELTRPLTTNTVTNCESPDNVQCLSCVRSVVCEHFIVYLQCEEGKVIHISAADYGRQDGHTCSAGRPFSQLQNTHCSSPSTLNKVGKMCNGKSVCSVKAINTVFGDPCYDTYKYLQVDYSCRIRRVVCEHFIAVLRCEEGKVIHISAADYGRQNSVICSFGRPSSQLQNTHCSSPSTLNKVGKMCNGKSVCSVKATNTVFGDPCYGTYKYLQVDYSCRTASV